MQLPKVYEPNQYESDIYALWEKSGAFEPTGKGEPYSIVMPPPNANANLHIGYALVAALEDIPTRYHRMKGHRTLLLPGADHAGFETQSVYEKHLAKEGKSRFDFSREELYTQLYDFVAANRHNFESQFRRLGISSDWGRFTFTLDEKIVTQAYKTFKKMWDDGLVYRGERLVNYCTFHGTAFADIEVEHKEEQGNLWFIKYPLTDGSGELVVATTRPETMLGDTGVAVHPEDERYGQYVGRTVKLPITGREVPIVADEFVDREFGTGAVKLTPAHDQNDYDAASRHSLPHITVISHEGKMTHEVPEKYRGLSVKDARKQVVADLDAKGWLVKTESHVHNVGHCYKCGTIIEPMLREQWFIDMQPLAKKAIKRLKAGDITFYPDSKREQLITYLGGLRDWNISRQIAWGIPIPAFQNIEDPEDWIFDERVNEGVLEIDGKTYRRDADVFDTWFSSSSWPYATLGVESDDFKNYYPLSLMETGGEILYPWVSRMIMLGLYVTGEVPFKAVYINGYVMAEDGSKMSKSIGNVVDPMPVIDQYGSDALRMGIISGRSPAVNRGYDIRRVEEARNFCNKLWNIARFIEDKLGDSYERTETPVATTAIDHWMLQRTQRSIEEIESHLNDYRFSEAYETLYHFVWDDMADWYIEASKSKGQGSLLGYMLETILKLAHPFAPFVTETIWQTLPWTGDSLLAVQKWPKAIKSDAEAANEFDEIRAIITESRAILRAIGTKGNHLYYKDDEVLGGYAEMIARMSGLAGVREVSDGIGLALTTTSRNCWLDIDHTVAASYSQKIQEQLTSVDSLIAQYEARLGNESYVKGAPKHIVAQSRQELVEAQSRRARLIEEKERFESLA
ncbi:MAG: valine--tRNA ligase [Candidatus Saccharimonadales bacterium]